MLRQLAPFGGAGSQVLKLAKAGKLNQATHAFQQNPDSAGAVILMSHLIKRYSYYVHHLYSWLFIL